MNYEGTDLGYELGYETDEVRASHLSSYQFQSPQHPAQTYSMGPGAVPASGNAAKILPGVTPDSNKPEGTKGKDDTKDAKVPTYRPDSKAELSKMERNRQADMPFFFESAKDLNSDLTPSQTQDAQHLKKQGVEDKYVQKAYLGLIDKQALERGAKTGGVKFEEMDSQQLHEEAARNLVRKTSDELKSKGYSDDAVKEYLLANGMIESTSTIPPRDKYDIHLPRKTDGSGEIDYGKFGPYDVARQYNKLGSLGEGAPHEKPKWGRLSTAKQQENDAHLSAQSKFTTAREKWLAQASRPKSEGGLGSRAEGEKVLSQMGLMGNVQDPEASAAKLFKANTQGEPILSTQDGVTTVNGEARLPGNTISAAEYKKLSAEDKAKFEKENPVAAGVLKAESHGDLQNNYTAALTDKPPHGLGIHPHEAKGILSSKFAGDPPLFDTNGKLKTAEEMGLSQEAYDQRLAQLDGKITEAKKDVLGKAFVLDEEGNPETITNEDGETIYKMKSEDPADQQKDTDRLLKARSDWRDDRKAEAREYHRERAVEQLRKIGVDEKNMEMLLHGRNLLSDEADPTEIAKFANELEAVDPKNRGDKKKELLKEIKDKDYNAPEDNSPEGQNFAKFKTGKDAQKQGNAQRGNAKSDEAQRNRDHQTSERKAQEAFSLKRDEAAHKRQMEMKEYDREVQMEMEEFRMQNQEKLQKEMADYNAEIQKERDGRQFAQQLGQSAFQSLTQMASQFAMANMQNAFQTSQAMMQGTYQMIAASQPRPFDLVTAMLGGAPRRA